MKAILDAKSFPHYHLLARFVFKGKSAKMAQSGFFKSYINVFTTRQVIKLLIYDFFCRDKGYLIKNIFLCTQNLKIYSMKKEELNVLATLVAEQVVEKLKSVTLADTEYVDTEEAARILGVSANYLRQVKDRYPHVKAGDQKQGRIMFRRDALLNEFK